MPAKPTAAPPDASNRVPFLVGATIVVVGLVLYSVLKSKEANLQDEAEVAIQKATQIESPIDRAREDFARKKEAARREEEAKQKRLAIVEQARVDGVREAKQEAYERQRSAWLGQIAADFAEHAVGQRYQGLVTDDSGTTQVTATVISKLGSAEEGTAELVLLAESEDPTEATTIVAKYPQVGATRRRTAFGGSDLPKAQLRFTRVALRGVPKRRNSTFFSAPTFVMGENTRGDLVGYATRGRLSRTSQAKFVLKKIDPIEGPDAKQRTAAALTPGKLYRGTYRAKKRIGYNESEQSEEIEVRVTAPHVDQSLYLLVSRRDGPPSDRSVIRLARGSDERAAGSWYWTGERALPSLFVNSIYSEKNYLLGAEPTKACPIAARVTSDDRLVLLVAGHASAVLSPAGDTRPESPITAAIELRATIPAGSRHRGRLTIGKRHWPGRKADARDTVIPCTLLVSDWQGDTVRVVLQCSGINRFTCSLEGRLATSPHERLRAPLKLVRKTVQTHVKARGRVTLLCQESVNASSPVLWLRLAERDGKQVLIGKTAYSEELLCYVDGSPPDDPRLARQLSEARDQREHRAEKLLVTAKVYLNSDKPKVVRKGVDRLMRVISHYSGTPAAAEALLLFKEREPELRKMEVI